MELLIKCNHHTFVCTHITPNRAKNIYIESMKTINGSNSRFDKDDPLD